MFDKERQLVDKFLSEKKEYLVDKFVNEKREQLDHILEEMTPEWLKAAAKEQRNWEELEAAFESSRAIEKGIPKIGTGGVYEISNERQFQ